MTSSDYLNRAYELGKIVPNRLDFLIIKKLLTSLQEEAEDHGVIVAFNALTANFANGFNGIERKKSLWKIFLLLEEGFLMLFR